MPSHIRAVSTDHGDLFNELERVRQRPSGGAFTSHDKQGPLEIPVLSRIVRSVHGDLGSTPARQNEALTAVLARAIEALPTVRLPNTPKHSTVTCREAARLMFRVPPLSTAELREIEAKVSNGSTKEFSVTARYVQIISESPLGSAALRKINIDIRNMLTDILLEMETPVSDTQAESSNDDTNSTRSVAETLESEGRPESSVEIERDKGKFVNDNRHAQGVTIGDYAFQFNVFGKKDGR